MRSLYLLGACYALAYGQSTIAVTGREVPDLISYENALRTIMQRWSIPGASMAISDGGRLVYARGFGLADRENGVQVQPASIFRLASISKTFTGMAILKLVQDGRLSLDARFVDVIPNITPPPNVTPDPRLRDITIRQLLQHTGGWDKDIPEDHVLQYTAAARALGADRTRLTPAGLARYAIGQRLDFNPGTRYSYSQTGYTILGRVIEGITGKGYEEAVRELVLAPAGVTAPKIGRSLPSQREPDEVKYYDYPNAPLVTTPVVPGIAGPAPRPYANRWMELNEAFGGWIGTAPDLLKWINTLEGRRQPPILNAASLSAIIQRPPVTPSGEYVGLTWRITPVTGGQHWWHSGGASGTRNLLTRRQNNRNWVVLMNSRPENEDQIITDLFQAMAAAEQQVRTWPTHDLFPDFDRPRLATSAETLTFTHTLGAAAPAAQVLQLTAAPASVNFTIPTPSAAWIRVDRLSGATPAAVNVSVDPSALQPGEYTTTLSVNAPNSSNGSRTVVVTLRVAAAAPVSLSAIRNSASRETALAAAPGSRVVIEHSPLTGEGLTVGLTDSARAEFAVPAFRSAPGWLEIVIPAEAALGEAAVTVTGPGNVNARGALMIEAISPGVFTANQDGKGAPVGRAIRTAEDGSTASEPLAACEEGPGSCVPSAIVVAGGVTIELEATGFRGQPDLAAFSARIGDEIAEVIAVAASESTAGTDLITLRLPESLAGRGEVDLVVSAGEKAANAVKLTIQ